VPPYLCRAEWREWSGEDGQNLAWRKACRDSGPAQPVRELSVGNYSGG